MTSHGFGTGKLSSEKTTLRMKDDIAKCISNVPGVLWAHVVHKSFHYDPREATPKSRDAMQVKDRYDLLWEMTGPCDLGAITECAREQKHQITIDLVTVKDQSWRTGGKPGKHPKKTEI